MTIAQRFSAFLSLTLFATVPAYAQSALPVLDASAATGEKAVVAFLVQDGVGDVELGRLGTQRGVSASVRALAHAMEIDHAKTVSAASRVAGQLSVEDATMKPESTNQIALSHLARYTGSKFDREYVKTLVDAHKSDIDELTDALEFTKTAAVRSLITSTIAVDRKHLRMALAAQALVGKSE